jgi:hypothetical protein
VVQQTYELLLRAKTGDVESVVVTGFKIPIRAIFDEKEHLAALRAILQSTL